MGIYEGEKGRLTLIIVDIPVPIKLTSPLFFKFKIILLYYSCILEVKIDAISPIKRSVEGLREVINQENFFLRGKSVVKIYTRNHAKVH